MMEKSMHWLLPSIWKLIKFLIREGEHFVSGGEDKQLKLWGYDEGMQQYVGNGHAGSITKLQFSPD